MYYYLYHNGVHVLQDKWVLAVAGTHGKTTASSMLAWILEYAGMKPGFLIGGVPENFGVSARLGSDSSFFVIEADEYDTAFFDKRSKFGLFRVESFNQFNTLRFKLGTHGRINTNVATGNLVPSFARNNCNATHEGATNAENMDMHGLAP